MKAAVIRKFGEPEVLRQEEVPIPAIGPRDVLIRVLATGLNRLEDYIRAGSVLPSVPFPHVLGSDAVGVVEEIGPEVHRFHAGDRVIPMPGYPLDERDRDFRPISAAASYAIGGIVRWGTYAQYIAVPEQWVLEDSTGLSPEEVATLPMTLLTAVRGVRNVGRVQPGDHVLVHAGASGTGSMNIQIAKALGAHVATTVDSGDKAEFARSLGSDLIVDVRSTDFVQAVRDWTGGGGADVVLDNLGGDVFPRSLEALRALGVLVAMGFVTGQQVSFHVREFFFSQKEIRGTLMGDVEDLQWGLDLVAQGKVRPLLDHALPLREAADAHRLLAANRVRGSLAMLPWAA